MADRSFYDYFSDFLNAGTQIAGSYFENKEPDVPATVIVEDDNQDLIDIGKKILIGGGAMLVLLLGYKYVKKALK